MALNIDKNFKPSLDTTRRRGRSNPRSSFVKILAAPPPTPAESRKTLYNLQDEEEEEEEEEIFMAREEKMGLLDIDLNVLPQDDSPTAKKGVNDQERRQTAVAAVASNFGEMKVSCQSECGSNFNRIAEEVLDENKKIKKGEGDIGKRFLM
ncbi:hypothetical protein Pfo_017991 [Paulownia fortunei]|nr:hypothetical protein Pfo_017991 [Paulownia fortunei]